MAVVFDNAVTAKGTGITSLTFSHTVTGTNKGGVVGTGSSASGTVPSGVTWNGVAMTSIQSLTDPNFGNVTVSQWGLINPATGNIVVSISPAQDLVVGSISMTGVDQTTLVTGTHKGTASGTTTAVSKTITSAAGEMCVDVINWDTFTDTITASVGAGQTQRWQNFQAGGNTHTAGSTEAGAASVAMTWTLSAAVDAWVSAACSVNPSAATSDLPPLLPRFDAMKTLIRM